MNFVKGRDEIKRFLACFAWFIIVFAAGFLASFIFMGYKDIKFNYWLCAAVGGCFYCLIIILTCSIKTIKAGVFEASTSKTGSSPDNNYKIFAFGIEPYVRNKLDIKLDSADKDWAKIQNSKEYHNCELKVYETIANRRVWSIFCPFIGTEVLTLEEIDAIVQICK